MKRIYLLYFVLFSSLSSFAFPSWIGNPSVSQSSTSQDVTFSVWMNEDYLGLNCKVGILEGITWTEYPMNYSTNTSGNSVWTVTKSLNTNASAYYFKGYDCCNTIYLNNGGNNYSIAINPTSAQNGNWSSNSTWCDGTVPGSGNFVIANNVNVDQNISVTNLTINSSKVLSINSTKSLTVSVTLTNSSDNTGLVVKSGGSLIQNSAVSATVERDMNNADWAIGKDGWHFLSSPVASQAINPNFTTAPYDFYAWWEATNEWINY